MNQQEKKLRGRIFAIFKAEVEEIYFHNRSLWNLLTFEQICEVKFYAASLEEALASPKGQELIAKSSLWKIEKLFITRSICYLADKFAHEQTVRVL